MDVGPTRLIDRSRLSAFPDRFAGEIVLPGDDVFSIWAQGGAMVPVRVPPSSACSMDARDRDGNAERHPRCRGSSAGRSLPARLQG